MCVGVFSFFFPNWKMLHALFPFSLASYLFMPLGSVFLGFANMPLDFFFDNKIFLFHIKK